MGKKKQDALVVVGIDFGTTYSGYGYSFRDEYQKDHRQIYSNPVWKSGDGLVTIKTPTVILFDEIGEFHSFGYKAEEAYSRLLEEDKADGYSYFSRFKMKLFQDEDSNELVDPRLKGKNTISRNMILGDDNGHTMDAMKVFSESIKYLKDHFVGKIEKSSKVEETDIHWVLTVPAIWKDNAKQFMRQAAEQAGIDPELLTLAYEPEAAAIYCKELTVQKKEGAEGYSLKSFEPGQQFLVLDCGGGTIDVTSYQVQNDSELKELHIPSGGPWGCTCVDREYLDFLEELFGHDVWSEFIKQNPEDLLDIKRKFEAKKTGLAAQPIEDVSIQFPPSLFKTYCEKLKIESLQKGFETSPYSQTIKVAKDKLRFDPTLITQFFEKTIDSIIAHVKEILDKNKSQGGVISTILMVGGFSDSPLLHKRVTSEFPKLNVICPNDAVATVLKGAVMYGHNPELINERICPRTYGITVDVPFDDRKHPSKLKTFSNGKYVCTDVFKVIVRSGEPLIVGKSIFEVWCVPNHERYSKPTVELYESSNKNPMYTSEKDVKFLGMLTVPMSAIDGGNRRCIKITMHFGYTELFVTASEEGTNRKDEAQFDCLLK